MSLFLKQRGLAATVAVLGLALLAVPAAQAKRPMLYQVKMTYTLERPWTYRYEQRSEDPPCVRTDDGSGTTRAKARSKALLNISENAVAGFGTAGTYTRLGTRTHRAEGPECGQPAEDESTVGCGTKEAKAGSAVGRLVGRRLILDWDVDPVADIDCPSFDFGANEALVDHRIPNPSFRSIVTKVNITALRRGAERVTAQGTSTPVYGAESCAYLAEPCPQGVSYDASARVTSTVKFTFTRRRR